MRKCSPGWLDTYMEYTKIQESPKAFHKWTALATLSACLGRNVWIPRIKYTIFPNLYVILIAESARCRKSVAVGIGHKILRSMKEPPMIFAQKITVEALIEALRGTSKQGYCSGQIFSSELSVFLGCDAIKKGIIPALTDLYDSPNEWVYHTRGRGKEILRNVTLCLLGATTRGAIKDTLPKGSVSGGFTSRIIFVYERDPAQSRLFTSMTEDDVEESHEEAEIRRRLIADLDYIAGHIHGKMIFSRKAKIKAHDWYEAANKIDHDARMDGYYGRKHDTMFKVAALLSISENDKLQIDEHHIVEALELLKGIEKSLGWITLSVESTQTGDITAKIYELIRKEPNITHSNLLKNCWRFANAFELGQSIDTLVQSNEVKMYLDKQNMRKYLVEKERE